MEENMKRIVALLVTFVMALSLASFASAQTKTTKTKSKIVAAKAAMHQSSSKRTPKGSHPMKHAVAKAKWAKRTRARHSGAVTAVGKTHRHHAVKRAMKVTHAARRASGKPTMTRKPSKQVQKQ